MSSYRWHIFYNRHDSVLNALTAYSVKVILIKHGFAVEQLPESQSGVTVSHHSPYALTLLLLKDQLPYNITVEEIV